MFWKFIIKKLGVSGITKMMERRAVKKIQDHEKRIKLLEKDSHPSQEYICCKKCGCEISKIKKRRK
tara:strand:+ start:175 stop:372 length:198 start_codon:yes stop_codon:yes gene_type:complete